MTILDAPTRDAAEAAARALADGAQGSAYAGVLAAGGDGTANAVAKGLLGSDIPMGILPLGTANVLARELLGTPGPRAMADILEEGAQLPLRPGLANGHPFLLMVSVGLDARAVARVRAPAKRSGGALAYAFSGFEALAAGLDSRFEVRCAGFLPATASWVIAARSALHAGGVRLGPARALDASSLRVLFTDRTGRLGLAQILMARALRLPDPPGVHVHEAAQLEISGPAGEPVQMDGERWGHLPLHLCSSPQTVKVFVSRRLHPRARPPG